MSLLFVEGFDDGLALTRISATSLIVPADIGSGYGRHGNGVRLGDTPNNRYYRLLPTEPTYVTVGFAFKVVDVGGLVTLCGLHTSNFYRFYLRDTDMAVGIYNQQAGSVYSAADAFALNTWHYFEARTYFADSPNGYMEVRIDGSVVVSMSGVDTYYSVNKPNLFDIGDTVDDIYIDDIYVLTGETAQAYLGDIEVVTLLPNGNGNSSVMLGSDADSTDNYLLVDNNAAIPPATTEYVGSATEGDKDTYAMEDLTGTPTVLGVQATVYAAMTDTGPKYMRPIMRSGTTDYPGTSIALLNSAYKTIDEVWETDPDTAVAWLYGGVNAAEVGQEVRDS